MQKAVRRARRSHLAKYPTYNTPSRAAIGHALVVLKRDGTFEVRCGGALGNSLAKVIKALK